MSQQKKNLIRKWEMVGQEKNLEDLAWFIRKYGHLGVLNLGVAPSTLTNSLSDEDKALIMQERIPLDRMLALLNSAIGLFRQEYPTLFEAVVKEALLQTLLRLNDKNSYNY